MASSHPAWSHWSDATVLDDYAMATTTTTLSICLSVCRLKLGHIPATTKAVTYVSSQAKTPTQRKTSLKFKLAALAAITSVSYASYPMKNNASEIYARDIHERVTIVSNAHQQHITLTTYVFVWTSSVCISRLSASSCCSAATASLYAALNRCFSTVNCSTSTLRKYSNYDQL